jgi:hypothetical protein
MTDEAHRTARLLDLVASEERSRRAGHPSPERLAAYHAGETSPAETEDIQEHLGICRHCARMVLDLQAFYDDDDDREETPASISAARAATSAEPSATSCQPASPLIAPAADPATRSWHTLRARLASDPDARPAAPGEGAPPLPRPGSPSRARLSATRLRILYAVAAALALCLTVLLWRAAQDRRDSTRTPQAQLVFLPAVNPEVSRGVQLERPIEVRLSGGPLQLIVPVSAAPTATFRLELLTRRGDRFAAQTASPVPFASLAAARAAAPPPPAGSMMVLSFFLTSRQLTPGAYHLRVSVLSADGFEPVADDLLQILGR